MKNCKFIQVVIQIVAFLSFTVGLMAVDRALAVEQVYTAKVKRVIDGDTFTIYMKEHHALFGSIAKIRISGIDAPELRGSCEEEKWLAKKSREILKNMIEGKSVDLVAMGIDSFGRVLAVVYFEGQNVGRALIEKGLAVPYKRGSGWC